MVTPCTLLLKCAIFLLPLLVSCKQSPWLHENFLRCLSYHSRPDNVSENVVHSFWSPSYVPILQSRIRNLRFISLATPKPYYIITPENANHVKATVVCSKKHNLEMRIRGGGHDYEGLSYVSPRLYVMLDMSNIQDIDIDVKKRTAWVGGGATIGDVYYHISKKSLTLGFPGGVCPTVGVGGQISGGGQGMLMRKYGLASDNMIDAVVVDVNGRVLDRESMGEDMFWAIRGGGAGSFGVVIKYKIMLVIVPPIVTSFQVSRTQEEGANKLIFRWQEFLDEMPRDLFIRVMVMPTINALGKPIIKAAFHSLFLGSKQELLSLLDEKFPELRIKATDCHESTWINSTLFFDFYQGQEDSVNELIDGTCYKDGFFKGKSDYVNVPIREDMLAGIWDVFLQGTPGTVLFQPYGGMMGEIPTNQTAFPHRAGILYNIHYYAQWHQDTENVVKEKLDWMNRLYNYMENFVTKPRTAYLNYRDLDLGKNEYMDDSYLEAKTWGYIYYKDNFERLAQIKQAVDPENFFRHEQSVPPFRERYA